MSPTAVGSPVTSFLDRSLVGISLSRWAQLLLGLVFLTAAGAKGTDLVRFGRQVETLTWAAGLPQTALVEALAWALAAALVGVEFAVASALISGRRAATAARAAIGLLALFILVILWEMLRGRDADCGCFGAIISRSAREALLDDLILLVPAIAGARHTERQNYRSIATIGLLVAGAAWCLFFYYIPPQWAALRPGVRFWSDSLRFAETTVLSRAARESTQIAQFVWFFDPDCPTCQRSLPTVRAISATAPGALVGIAAATPGQIEEFRVDFDPGFPLQPVTTEAYRAYGVHNGTLVELRIGRVAHLWHGYELDSAAFSGRQS